MRLDRVLAEAGAGSRQQVAASVRSGRVTVGDRIADDPAEHVDPRAPISVDGAAVVWRPFHHRLLHKPAGTVTSTVDRDGPSILGVLPEAERARDWMPVGRLDADVEGLLLVTTDGELAHRLTHPRFGVDKVYEALLERPATDEDVAVFRAGLPLDGKPLRPADLAWTDDPRRVRLTIHEGKFHQVKRMFLARGNRVVALRRVSFGPVDLPIDLSPGGSRALTLAEERALYAAVGLVHPEERP